MVKMNGTYQGQKHCEFIHESSNSKIETDAPKDNNGKGERFSPTDLVGASLGSCILTTMAIVAEKEGFADPRMIEGAKARVAKIMTDKPRRIDTLQIEIDLPARLTPDQRKRLEQIAANCPVAKSIHPDIKLPMKFNYV